MKNKLIYITSFLAAFVGVTFGIIHLNQSYKNIFSLDFTEVEPPAPPMQFASEADKQTFENLKNYFDNEFRSQILDSIKASTLIKIDTVYQEVLKDESLLDSLDVLNAELKSLQKKIAEQVQLTENAEALVSNPEEIDEEWTKKTAKLIESMNPKDAAKVIQKYSDNEARELIYKMKQNKAAAILSNLNPDFVNRITKSEI